VGVSHNIIAASWQAMVESLEYKLVKDAIEPHLAGPSIVMEAEQKSLRPPNRRSRHRKRDKRRFRDSERKERQQEI
jgi:hypothetical protein